MTKDKEKPKKKYCGKVESPPCDIPCIEYENGRVICPVHGRLYEGDWKETPRKMKVIEFYIELTEEGLPKFKIEYDEH